MGKEFKVTTVEFNELPSKTEAHKFLNKIIENEPFSVSCKLDKPIVLYGAGKLGKMAKKYFNDINIPISFVVDKNPALYKNDSFWNGINIVKAENVQHEISKSLILIVCIASEPISKILRELKNKCWYNIIPFYDVTELFRDKHPLENGWCTGSLYGSDLIGINSVLSRLEDDTSRAHYLQFIAWHSIRQEWFFDKAPVVRNDKYFIPQIVSVLNNEEVFVDVGAHYGDVINKFLRIVNNEFKEIYAIEPDVENFSNLIDNIHSYENKISSNIHLISCALGAMKDVKCFYSGLGYMSKFSILGNTYVDIKTLDDLSIDATLIKIHVEGYEKDVIDGGIKTIINNRPIMVVTSYHNKMGLLELPRHLMTCLNNYAFYFRLHDWHGTGEVIYAIPRERVKKVHKDKNFEGDKL